MVTNKTFFSHFSFNRRWLEYKFGFGNLYGEHWLGNEVIHAITTQVRNYCCRDLPEGIKKQMPHGLDILRYVKICVQEILAYLKMY